MSIKEYIIDLYNRELTRKDSLNAHLNFVVPGLGLAFAGGLYLFLSYNFSNVPILLYIDVLHTIFLIAIAFGFIYTLICIYRILGGYYAYVPDAAKITSVPL